MSGRRAGQPPSGPRRHDVGTDWTRSPPPPGTMHDKRENIQASSTGDGFLVYREDTIYAQNIATITVNIGRGLRGGLIGRPILDQGWGRDHGNIEKVPIEEYARRKRIEVDLSRSRY